MARQGCRPAATPKLVVAKVCGFLLDCLLQVSGFPSVPVYNGSAHMCSRASYLSLVTTSSSARRPLSHKLFKPRYRVVFPSAHQPLESPHHEVHRCYAPCRRRRRRRPGCLVSDDCLPAGPVLTPTPSISAVPSCLLQCVTASSSAAGCSGPTDVQCMCVTKQSEFITASTPCILQNKCDINQALQLLDQVCTSGIGE